MLPPYPPVLHFNGSAGIRKKGRIPVLYSLSVTDRQLTHYCHPVFLPTSSGILRPSFQYTSNFRVPKFPPSAL